jgi:16S rRNA (guanine1207-N2)-methyltransferase
VDVTDVSGKAESARRRTTTDGIGVHGQFPKGPLGVPTLLIVEVLNEQHAVEMIEFMLKDPGLKVISLEFDGVAVQVHATQQHLTGTDDRPVQPRHAEASFLEFPFPGTFHNLGVDQHASTFVAVEHEDPAADADLGRRQAQAWGVVHDFEHVIDQVDQGAINLGHVIGTLPQDRVANYPDVIGNHGLKGSVAPMPERTPGSHYFSDHRDQPAPKSSPRRLEVMVDGRSLELASDTGVFSHGHLDDGTALLIERGATPPPDATDLLDLGCGYGPVALALAVRAPSARIWAVDVNPRAVELCAANAAANDLTNVHAVTVEADPELGGLDPDLRFDGMWSNPPVRVGKPALHRLLLAALGRLGPDATAHLVVHKHLGSDSLQSWLTTNGHPTTRKLSRMGFRLLDVVSGTGEAA